MPRQLETYSGYDPYRVKDHFDGQPFVAPDGKTYTWKASVEKHANVTDVNYTKPNSRLRCPDGRFDYEKKNEKIEVIATENKDELKFISHRRYKDIMDEDDNSEGNVHCRNFPTTICEGSEKIFKDTDSRFTK